MKNTLSHKIRIIAGKYRGRKIDILDREGLRPVPNRVRETVFNWLQFELSGAHVLDAFAGSGAMGLESLSRGADSVLFLDNNRDSAAHIRSLLQAWNETHGRVLQTDALTVSPATNRYDLIFLDPPFSDNNHALALTHFANTKFLKPHGKIYLETPFPLTELPVPEGFYWHKQSKAGKVHFGLLAYEDKM